MLTAILWIVISAFCGMFAASRGRSFVAWFIVSLLFSPVIAAMLLLLLPKSFRTS